jgi:hypothetical protein
MISRRQIIAVPAATVLPMRMIVHSTTLVDFVPWLLKPSAPMAGAKQLYLPASYRIPEVSDQSPSHRTLPWCPPVKAAARTRLQVRIVLRGATDASGRFTSSV